VASCFAVEVFIKESGIIKGAAQVIK
jgi:hypothetical protein